MNIIAATAAATAAAATTTVTFTPATATNNNNNNWLYFNRNENYLTLTCKITKKSGQLKKFWLCGNMGLLNLIPDLNIRLIIVTLVDVVWSHISS